MGHDRAHDGEGHVRSRRGLASESSGESEDSVLFSLLFLQVR